MRISIAIISIMALVIAGCQSSQNSSSLNNNDVALGDTSTLEPNTATMWVHGMGCPQCAYNVDAQLLKVPGVEDVKVDMSTGKVVAKLSPQNPPTKEQLSAAIDKTGFTLKRIEMP